MYGLRIRITFFIEDSTGVNVILFFSPLDMKHFARNGSRVFQFLNKTENCHDPVSAEKKQIDTLNVTSSQSKVRKEEGEISFNFLMKNANSCFCCQPYKSREESQCWENSILLTAICKSFRMALLLPVPQYAMANVYMPDRRSTGSLSVVKLVTNGSASSKRAYIVNAIPTAKPRKIFSCCVSCAYCVVRWVWKEERKKDRN